MSRRRTGFDCIAASFDLQCRRPNFPSPVMVLTAHELFADMGPPECWRGAGQRFAQFVENYRGLSSDLLRLCDATQQLHLGMESDSESQATHFAVLDKRRKIAGKQPEKADS